VFDLLEVSARRYPDRVAVVDETRSLTYREYRERAGLISAAIVRDGCTAGDRVGALLANSVAYAEVIFGFARAGIISAHLSFRSSAAELSALLADSGARTLIFDAEYAETVSEVLAIGEWSPEIEPICVGAQETVTAREFELWIADAGAVGQANDDEPIFYLGFTSGTTGRSKGARITQASRVLTAVAACVEYGLGEADVTLMFTPMHHGGPLVFVLTPAVVGGRLVIMRRFDPDAAWDVIERERVTNAFVVPTILGRLADSRRGKPAPPSLRVLISNAAPLPTVTKEAILAVAPELQLHEFYGSTEAGIVTNLRPADQLRKVRCAGQPLMLTEVEIRDPDGGVLGPGEVGELYSRSPYLFDGYHELPEATAEALIDGWVSAGDLAKMDDEGFIYIVDRTKDLIISGGINIYPREIEDALLKHASISEAAVIGVPDDDWGESVKAFVVIDGPEADAQAVVAEATAELASYKRPREVEVREWLPRTSTGKVLKRELRDSAWVGREAKI
jgi:acyl-CoA synthetase (AMP-forming)/AMP-acid ligase II